MEETNDFKKIYTQFLVLERRIDFLYGENKSRYEMTTAISEQINILHRRMDDVEYRLKAAENKIEVIANKAFLAIETLYPGRNHAEVEANEALARIVEEARKKPKA